MQGRAKGLEAGFPDCGGARSVGTAVLDDNPAIGGKRRKPKAIKLVIWIFAISAAGTACAAALLVGIARTWLLRQGILDWPNDRSSHTTPTPHGGGLGVLAALLPVWFALPFILPPGILSGSAAIWLIPLAALGLGAVSWIDDLRPLGPLPRLGAQFAAALAGAALIPGLVFQGLLPGPADMIAAAVGWVWFVNLFNFMDGIDGISGVETIAIGGGLVLIGIFAPHDLDATHGQALAIAAAAVGFLVWNWHPAKIFLGDAGSIPLGYLLGWLLLVLAAGGDWQAALILPLYYLADATITLLRRLARKQKPWEAHRDHYFQVAVKQGISHSQISSAIGLVNVLLVLLALAAATADPGSLRPWGALLAAGAVVLGLLAWLAGRRAANH